MEISPHVEAIQRALDAVAGDDPATTAVAERLAAAVAPALQLQLLDLLGQVALEVSAQLPDGRIDVQLAGRDAICVYRDESAAPTQAPIRQSPDDEAGTARLTLRMSEPLKTAVEAAAAAAGMSTNAWLVNAASQALQPPTRRGKARGLPGSRLTGYAQA